MKSKPFFILTVVVAFITNCNIAFPSEDETVLNPIYYLSANPDLIAAGYTEGNVDYHWVNHGIYEGRRGASAFDVHFYLREYSDLQQAFGNDYHAATIHWINSGIYEGRRCVRYYPKDATTIKEIIRFAVPPSGYRAVTAHVIGVTLEPKAKPLIASVYMDYLRLVEKTQTGQQRIIAFREYNESHGSLVPYGGGLYDRFKEGLPAWFNTDNHTPIDHSSIEDGFLFIDVSKTPDKIAHWWIDRTETTPYSKYFIESRFKVEGELSIQFGVDYWVSLSAKHNGGSWDCTHNNCLAWKSNWYGDTNNKFITVTVPLNMD